jgi:hypothetical protein
MKLQRTYKKGTLIKFKWYDNYRDHLFNPSNFRVIEGIVQENTFLNEVIVYNGHDDITYCVNTDEIIESF